MGPELGYADEIVRVLQSIRNTLWFIAALQTLILFLVFNASYAL